MKKIAIVYWSGTGNTAQMAEAVAEGAGAAGAQANLFTPSDFSPAQVKDYDAIAFGCPAMGAEQLEDFEFEPLFLQCAPELNGKDIALLRLGRRRVDADLGGPVQRPGCPPGEQQRHCQ